MFELVFDYGFWGLPVLVVSSGVFLLARARRRSAERLGRLASRRNGRVIRDPWFLAPRVVWNLAGTLLQVSVRGERASHGAGGVRCFAHAASPDYPPVELELRRAGRLGPRAGRDGWQSPETREADFDREFRLRTGDARFAAGYLDRELRHALQAFPPELDVVLRMGQASAYQDGLYRHAEREQRLEVSLLGLPEDTGQLERLLDLARTAHARLDGRPARRAA